MAGPVSPFFNTAAMTTDPVERMKYIITAQFAYPHPCHSWDKPLNPILGETFQSYLADGTKVFLEQISHKPPISYVCMEGPNNLYRWFGYAQLSVKAYFNSVVLDVTGYKLIEFNDGTSIRYTNQDDIFGNTLLGTMHH